MKRILVVEDNKDYRLTIVSALLNKGYKVDEAESPLKGLELVAVTKYDAVISDLNLPIMSGVLFTESVKNIAPNTVCIILTGDPDEISELESIDNDIDLYIEKSKPISVILRYLENLIKKYEEDLKKDIIITSRAENIKMYTGEHIVTKDDVKIDLTPKEFEMLKIFLLNKNKVITREDFIEQAWHEPAESIDTRLIDSHIRKLRDKIRSMSIMTVRGYGYKWNEVE